jgi:membrane associated rhomboid family serine protease
LIFAVNVFMFIGEIYMNANGQMQGITATWIPVREQFFDVLASGNPLAMLQCILGFFSAMFLHGSFMHILGNMCFFFTMAPALEARMGHARFGLFYMAAGICASFAFMFTDPSGLRLGMGASGAIGGLMGAYMLYFARARVGGWSAGSLNWPTDLGVFMMGQFALMQWVSIWMESMAGPGHSAGVGFWAHLGGIAFGMVVGALMLLADVGRLRWKDMVFYATAALATLIVFLRASSFEHGIIDAVIATVIVSALYMGLFLKEVAWKPVTPVLTMLVFLLGGFCVQQGGVAWAAGPGTLQVVEIGVIGMTIMVMSILVAVGAKRLPVVVKPIVIVPKPATPEDRILAEKVADLIVGFFRFIEESLREIIRTAVHVTTFAFNYGCRLVGKDPSSVLVPPAVLTRMSESVHQNKAAQRAAGLIASLRARLS